MNYTIRILEAHDTKIEKPTIRQLLKSVRTEVLEIGSDMPVEGSIS